MLCQICNQREANVHLTQIINGVKNEKHLCDECAKLSKNTNLHAGFSIGMPLSFQSILDGLFETIEIPQQMVNDVDVCPVCGMSLDDFRRIGRVGCSNCYEIFSSNLNPIIKRVHGNLQHTGKVPNRTGGMLKVQKELSDLKEKLRLAIEREEYEKAAEIRDNIRSIEAKINEDKNK